MASTDPVVEGLRSRRLVRIRLLELRLRRLLSRRNGEKHFIVDDRHQHQGWSCCHHRRQSRPVFYVQDGSKLNEMADACPEILEQIFQYVRSRDLRAVTLIGKVFKYQLECQEIWRQLYFMRFTSAFGYFPSWKAVYIQRDERCDRIKAWRGFFEATRRSQLQV